MKLNKVFSRRDFLKLSAMTSLSYAIKPLANVLGIHGEKPLPNVIILVFDAWSAEHVSFMGYQRDTMPMLSRFAERSTVYHNHYSAGTYTVPGTASLLTGLHPWSHRALHLGAISRRHSNHHIFSTLKPEYITVGYSQNKYADQFLYQAGKYLDKHIWTSAFDIQKETIYPLFGNDANVALASFEGNLTQKMKGKDASLFLGPLFRAGALYDRHLLDLIYRDDYPRGMPDAGEFFLFSDVVDGAIKSLSNLNGGTLAYFHFIPPHDPYRPTRKFHNKFRNDGLKFDVKNIHPLSQVEYEEGLILKQRRIYDEYMASWDDAVSRLFDYLDASGLLDNSYVIVTSDHGEFFERGEVGHFTYMIYESVIHVPLLIHSPKQISRADVHANTSSVDMLPTLASLVDSNTPDWAEGSSLPRLDGVAKSSRSVFTVDGKLNSVFAPLEKYSISITRDRHRLTSYKLPDFEGFEFYDLDDDPDEINNLYSMRPSIAVDMQHELLDKLADANRWFYR